MTFKPMLATDADLEKLRFPLLASAKLDGVRAVVRNGVVYSRSNKLIPNKEVQEKFNHLNHYDGELIFGNPCSKTCYRDTFSAVMTQTGNADRVSFYVFDHIENMHWPYEARQRSIVPDAIFQVFGHPQYPIKTLEELLGCEEWILDRGYEGLILRDPNSPYKMGRSTVREGFLLKLKRMVTDEAVIIGMVERLHNANVAVVNELGYLSRSSHQENKIGRGDMGALIVRDIKTGVEFNIGTGFSDEERKQFWHAQEASKGKIISYEHFPIGVKDKPRHPTYKGFRDKIDL